MDRRSDASVPERGLGYGRSLLHRLPALRAGAAVLLGGYEQRCFRLSADPPGLARISGALSLDEPLAGDLRLGIAKAGERTGVVALDGAPDPSCRDRAERCAAVEPAGDSGGRAAGDPVRLDLRVLPECDRARGER